MEDDVITNNGSSVQLSHLVVALDPSTTATGDAAGIIVAGRGYDKKFYVLEDNTTNGSPSVWARACVNAYHTHKADRVVAESNQGGEMVEAVIKVEDADVPVKLVHASRGKVTRAEPIAALYEQGRVHHVGTFPELEDEMCEWTQGDKDSPNRMDALVWALTELMHTREILTLDRREMGL